MEELLEEAQKLKKNYKNEECICIYEIKNNINIINDFTKVIIKKSKDKKIEKVCVS